MTSVLRNLQFDVPADRFPATVAFWAAALGGDPVPSDGGRYVHLHGARSVVEVHLQRLEQGDRRIHLDLAAGPDLDAEVARLTGLGARVSAHDHPAIAVLEDPAGLVACLVEGTAPAVPVAPDASGGGVLTTVLIDVEAADVDAEVAFWAAALEVPPRRGEDDTFILLDGVRSASGHELTLEVQRVGPGGPSPAPRFHVDLAAADLEAEAVRLVSLGATRLVDAPGCITLEDPAGTLLCVIGLPDGGGDQ